MLSVVMGVVTAMVMVVIAEGAVAGGKKTRVEGVVAMEWRRCEEAVMVEVMMVEVVDVKQRMAIMRRHGDCEGDTTRGRGDGRDVSSCGTDTGRDVDGRW